MEQDLFENSDFDITPISLEGSKNLNLSVIPPDCLVEVADMQERNVYYKHFEGTFGWRDNIFCAFVSHDWYRKYWDYPLELAFHMDLMKRLVEFRKDEYKNIADIEFNDEGDWCHLTYTIQIPQGLENLHNALEYASQTTDWIDTIVETAQTRTTELINQIAQDYSKLKLLTLPELIDRLKTVKEADEKGKVLEEFSSRFFSLIKGFDIIERKRTRTEEIDLVILNKSDDAFWKNESNLILAECKNWTTKKAGKNEYVAFREKLENRKGRAKIGFFVSYLGYARTFFDEDLRNSKSDILVIPLEIKEMVEMVEKGMDISTELTKKYVDASSK
jgi:hypothetical protein